MNPITAKGLMGYHRKNALQNNIETCWSNIRRYQYLINVNERLHDRQKRLLATLNKQLECEDSVAGHTLTKVPLQDVAAGVQCCSKRSFT